MLQLKDIKMDIDIGIQKLNLDFEILLNQPVNYKNPNSFYTL